MDSIPKAVPQNTQDARRSDHPPLEGFFAPRSVAVIGATETLGSVGRTVLWNLIRSPFGGTVFPVNLKRSSVLGIKAYPNVAAVPERVDLVVVATPAPTVPGVIRECADAGVQGAIILSAGFKETGQEGAALEQQVLAEARRGKMRLIGPNCLGVMSPFTGLNATFASTMARSGSVGFLSQSGALCTAILDWSQRELVGFSAFVSLGSMLDVGWGDLIDHLGNDPNTQSILIYMESIGDARSFLSAAREVALRKPIIVIKAGRTGAAAKAAASHTGALAGSDEALDAAFRRCGVLRVNSISDLFYMAEVLARQPRPKGPRLTILTNAGGPGVLATDALLNAGGVLAPLSDETLTSLDALLPPHWSHNNPIDILGDADPERYRKTVEIAAKDPNSDGLLVILTPQAMTDPTQIAEQLKPYGSLQEKPLLASWMGGADVAAGESILNRADIPTFAYPDTAARIFNSMWHYAYNLRGLYETPTLSTGSEANVSARKQGEQIIQAARNAGRTLLTEFESKLLLAAYGIPTVPTRLAADEDEAVTVATEIGFPVVLKLHSETITHKTEVNGVQLNLQDAEAVREAFRTIASSVSEKAGVAHFLGVTVQPMISLIGYEVIVGSSIDTQFGPMLLFGSGGQLVEVYRDRALALPPLNTTLARRMMEQTRIYTALQGVRGREAVDLVALEQLLVRFSHLIVEQRWIAEMDINPLLVSEAGMIALDARVVLHGAGVREEDLPRLAIRPYPVQYVTPWATKDGTPVTIRPIRPEDEPLMVRFQETLSDRSASLRFFQTLHRDQRTEHERLMRMCFIDYDRQITLVAECKNLQTGEPEIRAFGHLIKHQGYREAEFALVVSDSYQRQGLGTELLRRLLQIGRDEKLTHITADILPETACIQHICEKLGFRIRSAQENVTKIEFDLIE